MMHIDIDAYIMIYIDLNCDILCMHVNSLKPHNFLRETLCDHPAAQAFLADGLGFDVGVPSDVVVSRMKPSATLAHLVH